MSPAELPWLWIPVTVWAAFAQTLRNAAQRHLTKELGTLGATLVRFLYGLPFALLWLAALVGYGGFAVPSPNLAFAAWVLAGALAQIIATALLLRVMAERNFALGVEYSKTEIVQVAVIGLIFLGDPISPLVAVAVAFATVGVMLLSPPTGDHPIRALLVGWTARPALLGLASGACFAVSAVGYRGAALALAPASFLIAAGTTLVWAQALQTVLLGGWLLAREPMVVVRVVRAWRASLFAGFMGAAASAGWFTAMAIEPVAHVRTLGLVELLFTYVVSRRVFRERLRPLEMAGIALLTVGLVVVMLR
ncbi:MAG: EamA/RhaT family transporter [Proteobacteria bacterium]|nr:EamA/RhaT family transporter [Pseudomonadota bacterium]